jgi:hypothetical protein
VASRSLGDRGDDREPQARAAGVTGAPLVEAHEPLEDAVPIRLGYRRPVVVHRQRDALAGRVNANANGGHRMAVGVVDEIAD